MSENEKPNNPGELAYPWIAVVAGGKYPEAAGGSMSDTDNKKYPPNDPPGKLVAGGKYEYDAGACCERDPIMGRVKFLNPCIDQLKAEIGVLRARLAVLQQQAEMQIGRALAAEAKVREYRAKFEQTHPELFKDWNSGGHA